MDLGFFLGEIRADLKRLIKEEPQVHSQALQVANGDVLARKQRKEEIYSAAEQKPSSLCFSWELLPGRGIASYSGGLVQVRI